jgi:thioredoxin-like negative regulator of GroEL
MDLLETQEQFEAIYNDTSKTTSFIVYFTAAWCNPCKALDILAIVNAANLRQIPIYKCDVTINEYTVGYCGVRSFPTFQYMKPRKPLSELKSNNTNDVITWINTLAIDV